MTLEDLLLQRAGAKWMGARDPIQLATPPCLRPASGVDVSKPWEQQSQPG